LEAGEHELTKADSRNVFYIGVFYNNSGATALDRIETEQGTVRNGIYDLQGRKLNTVTRPGLYIIDGKKSFVK
jgi:hypothetical protein